MTTQRHIQLFESFMDATPEVTPGGKKMICLMSEGGWVGVGSILPGEEPYIEKLLSGELGSVEIQTLPNPATDAGVIVLRGRTSTFEFLGSGSVLDLEEGEDFVFPLLLDGKFFCYTAGGHTTDAEIVRTPKLSKL